MAENILPPPKEVRVRPSYMGDPNGEHTYCLVGEEGAPVLGRVTVVDGHNGFAYLKEIELSSPKPEGVEQPDWTFAASLSGYGELSLNVRWIEPSCDGNGVAHRVSCKYGQNLTSWTMTGDVEFDGRLLTNGDPEFVRKYMLLPRTMGWKLLSAHLLSDGAVDYRYTSECFFKQWQKKANRCLEGVRLKGVPQPEQKHVLVVANPDNEEEWGLVQSWEENADSGFCLTLSPASHFLSYALPLDPDFIVVTGGLDEEIVLMLKDYTKAYPWVRVIARGLPEPDGSESIKEAVRIFQCVAQPARAGVVIRSEPFPDTFAQLVRELD